MKNKKYFLMYFGSCTLRGHLPQWTKDIRTAVFKVAQMKCENCVRKINNNIRFEKGLKDFHTDLKTKTVTITYDADKTNVEKLKKGFQKFHYEAEFVKETKQDDKK